MFSTTDGAFDLSYEYSVNGKTVTLDISYTNNTDYDLNLDTRSLVNVNMNGGSCSPRVLNADYQPVEVSAGESVTENIEFELDRYLDGTNKWSDDGNNDITVKFGVGITGDYNGDMLVYDFDKYEQVINLTLDPNGDPV